MAPKTERGVCWSRRVAAFHGRWLRTSDASPSIGASSKILEIIDRAVARHRLSQRACLRCTALRNQRDTVCSYRLHAASHKPSPEGDKAHTTTPPAPRLKGRVSNAGSGILCTRQNRRRMCGVGIEGGLNGIKSPWSWCHRCSQMNLCKTRAENTKLNYQTRFKPKQKRSRCPVEACLVDACHMYCHGNAGGRHFLFLCALLSISVWISYLFRIK